jgi:hypothetical protein
MNKTNRCTEFQLLVQRLYMFRAAFLPETCRVLPIKLKFSASVGFIHFNTLLTVSILHHPHWHCRCGIWITSAMQKYHPKLLTFLNPSINVPTALQDQDLSKEGHRTRWKCKYTLTEWFMACRHYCRWWFPRSLWSKKLISIWVLFSTFMEWWVSFGKCAPVKSTMHVTLCDLEPAGAGTVSCSCYSQFTLFMTECELSCGQRWNFQKPA